MPSSGWPVDSPDLIISDKEIHKDINPQWMNKKYAFLLRIMKNGTPAFTVLDKLMAIIDEAMQRSYTGIVCKRGCSHCCYEAVGITAMEADYIQARTGHQVQTYTDEPASPATHVRRPCSFLKNDECQIYEHRPAVCRTFVTFDSPQFCENGDQNHWIMRLGPMGEGGNEFINTAYWAVITYFFKHEARWSTQNEIRAYFGEADSGEHQ